MELRTLGQADGPHAWNVKVRYRAGQEIKSLTLSLRGTVESDITVQPAIVGLHVATSVQQEITLTDRRPRPLRVVDVDVRASGVKLTHLQREGKTTRITIAADGAQLAPGRHEGVVCVTTDDADYGQLKIPIVVTKAATEAVRCVPEIVELRPVPGATNASALVRLRALTEQPVRIVRMAPSDPTLTCTWAPGPGNDATIRVRHQAAPKSELSGLTVAVHLAEPLGGIVTIPVTVRTPE